MITALVPSYSSVLEDRMKTEFVQSMQYNSSEYFDDKYAMGVYPDGYISVYQFYQKDSLLTPIVRKAKGQNSSISKKSKKEYSNYWKLYTSFLEHVNNAKESIIAQFEDIASSLKYLDINDSLAQYSAFDNMIDIDIILSEGCHLSIGKFIDEEYDGVDFTVSKGRRVIATGEMDVDELVSKIHSIIVKA